MKKYHDWNNFFHNHRNFFFLQNFFFICRIVNFFSLHLVHFARKRPPIVILHKTNHTTKFQFKKISLQLHKKIVALFSLNVYNSRCSLIISFQLFAGIFVQLHLNCCLLRCTKISVFRNLCGHFIPQKKLLFKKSFG